MAIAFVRSTAKARAAATSVAASFASLPAAGNFIAVRVWGAASDTTMDFTTTACTDNQGNTYTRAVNRQPAGINIRGAIYYAENIGSPSGTFTVTVNPAGTDGVIIMEASEYSGLATSSSLDQTAGANGTTDNATTSGTTPTTAQADELLVAMCCGDDSPTFGTNIVFTKEATWTNRVQEVNAYDWAAGAGEERIVAATGAYASTWTDNVTITRWLGCIATFKAAGGAPPAAELPGHGLLLAGLRNRLIQHV